MYNSFLFSYCILCFLGASVPSKAQLINWVTETGLPLGSTFVDGQIITNIAGTGLDARINVTIVGTDPKIDATDPAKIFIRDRTNCSFTLTFLNGSTNIQLGNSQNLLSGETITISNPNQQNITLQQTSNNSGGLMTIDGIAVPALNTPVVQDNHAVIKEVNDGAGTDWLVTMDSITSFTWLYNKTTGTSATEGFRLTLSSPILLPIQLINFSVEKQSNQSVVLHWQTETETNNDYFMIERSLDGFSWEQLATIKGNGTSSTLSTYRTIDSTPYCGVSYYRLLQTDFDGNIFYSPIKAIRIKKGKNLKLYPNPTNGQVTLEGNDITQHPIKIYDAMGKDITPFVQPIAPSRIKNTIDLSNLDTGLYYIKTPYKTYTIYKK
ncbi:T9SS type A sorting domain-containing protein [Aureispira anguillae]|uniref:T9SS type A sorting domain-containing protein n=1 Tax=Aureispira anguillae TaxID=2864201 RepID=A0A915YEI1_9BACT|nr:T9SS type A sorting domain-containing protein [Aureispira anguillae]BDS11648.1 T9SS type A sorting domain-containing protein [Aureispira anguillae]